MRIMITDHCSSPPVTSVSYAPCQVETIGDGYMVVVGIPNGQDKHAEYAAEMAIQMLANLKNVQLTFLKNQMTVKIG